MSATPNLSDIKNNDITTFFEEEGKGCERMEVELK